MENNYVTVFCSENQEPGTYKVVKSEKKSDTSYEDRLPASVYGAENQEPTCITKGHSCGFVVSERCDQSKIKVNK